MNNLQNTCNFKISCFLLTYLISYPVKCKFELDRQMFFWEMGDKITCEISLKLSDCIFLYYLLSLEMLVYFYFIMVAIKLSDGAKIFWKSNRSFLKFSFSEKATKILRNLLQEFDIT